MTGRFEHQPLRACPPGRLAELRGRVAALLCFEDLLPADLYVKLDLLHGDVSAVIRHNAGGPAPRRSPAFTPHDAGKRKKARDMPPARCGCGFTEDPAEDYTLGDHLYEMFAPSDGKGPDGAEHAEGPTGLLCLCGAGGSQEELDAHFIAVFTPADSIGLDGAMHKATG